MFAANLNNFRIPHLKFIQTLIVGKYTAQQLVSKLQELRLDFSAEDITKLYQELKTQQPEYFTSGSKDPDFDWLRELEVIDMWGYVFNRQVDESLEGLKGAFQILDDNHLRKVIIPMSMAGLSNEDIELTCSARFDINYEPVDFIKFIHYFANFKSWTNMDKELFTNACIDKDTKSFFQLALKGDKNYLLWKLGTAPNKSFDDMLREMFSDSFYHFKEKQIKQPEDAQRWGSLAVKISDRLDRLEQEANEKRNLFEDIKFKLEEDKGDNESPITTAEAIGAEVPDQNNSNLPNLEDLINKDHL